MTDQASMQPVRPRLLHDDFSTDLRRVIGSPVPTSPSIIRRGVDAERVLSIDHGALRIQPLAQPGWGRSGVAYGPYKRSPGLALAVLVSNGHNLSQTYHLKSWVRQVGRWLKGSGTDPMSTRFVRWLGHTPRMSFPRKLSRWYQSREGGPRRKPIKESLAVGFFPTAAPTDPLRTGNALIVHANEAFDNGELWARVADGHASSCQSLQNLPMHYIVVLRERGAAYYAASHPGAHGVGPYPLMRPIAIDPFHHDPEVFAAVYQAVLGEIGFHMDTRVHGLAVADLGPTWGSHSPHAYDALTGNGSLQGSAAGAGGNWRGGGFVRSQTGTRASVIDAFSYIDPGAPSGLVHAILDASPGQGPTGIAFRVRDASNFWALLADPTSCRLRIRETGGWTTVAEGPLPLRPSGPNSIQVVDHGSEFTITVNGTMAFGRRFSGAKLAEATGVGLFAATPGVPASLRELEAHPRQVPIPPELDLGSPPAPAAPADAAVLVRDDFSGPQGDLASHRTSIGNKEWRRDVGTGTLELTGQGAARVVADIGVPSPGRTIYTIEWDDPAFADIELEMTPPGTERGQTHRGRSGIVFWQDPRNYIMMNLWLHDNLDTASISTFFYINGFDDLFDAIWTCTGPSRTVWGVPFRFRVQCDGNRFLASIDGEPVLERALTDVYPHLTGLVINRIGLLANWEWGTDTGTIFKDFIARGRPRK